MRFATRETGCFFALTRETIDTPAIARQLLRGEDGAVVTFEGIMSNNTKGRPTRFLEYECYEAMAIKDDGPDRPRYRRRAAIGRIAMVHRLGRLRSVSQRCHRGCRAASQAGVRGGARRHQPAEAHGPDLEERYFADGEVWVDGEWDDSVLKK